LLGAATTIGQWRGLAFQKESVMPDWDARVMRWLMEVAALPMPEPEPGADAEAVAGLMMLTQGWLTCFSRCCHPSMRDEAARQVVEGDAEIGEMRRRFKVVMQKHGVVWVEH
jgi:hypothetical protein